MTTSVRASSIKFLVVFKYFNIWLTGYFSKKYVGLNKLLTSLTTLKLVTGKKIRFNLSHCIEWKTSRNNCMQSDNFEYLLFFKAINK